MQLLREEQKKKTVVILTCFNRKEHTIKAIRSIAENNPAEEFEFVVTDDASNDGTVSELNEMPYNIHVLEGNGSLFWGGGMRKSVDYVYNNIRDYDYAFIINDDVEFAPRAADLLIERLEQTGADAVAGATVGDDGLMTYGGLKKTSSMFVRLENIEPSVEPVECDTFNGNAVMIKKDVFVEAGNFDSHYIHSMGDFDYGFRLRKKGCRVVNGSGFVGKCNGNPIKGTWLDSSLPRRERLKKKESPKGLPKNDWFYFVKKNYNVVSAIYHFTTPYIKILIKK